MGLGVVTRRITQERYAWRCFDRGRSTQTVAVANTLTTELSSTI
jgi:hypothetical protein